MNETAMNKDAAAISSTYGSQWIMENSTGTLISSILKLL
jgi:hypothetical protein